MKYSIIIAIYLTLIIIKRINCKLENSQFKEIGIEFYNKIKQLLENSTEESSNDVTETNAYTSLTTVSKPKIETKLLSRFSTKNHRVPITPSKRNVLTLKTQIAYQTEKFTQTNPWPKLTTSYQLLSSQDDKSNSFYDDNYKQETTETLSENEYNRSKRERKSSDSEENIDNNEDNAVDDNSEDNDDDNNNVASTNDYDDNDKNNMQSDEDSNDVNLNDDDGSSNMIYDKKKESDSDSNDNDDSDNDEDDNKNRNDEDSRNVEVDTTSTSTTTTTSTTTSTKKLKQILLSKKKHRKYNERKPSEKKKYDD